MIMLELFKARMAAQGAGQAKAYLRNANMTIDKTFTRDPAYREVFITHAPSEIYEVKYDAKFSIHTRRSMSGDSEDYFVSFRPYVDVPIGAYIDIPDDNGELQRWMIILKDDRPQFSMYYVLKCNWVLKWKIGDKVYKVEGVLRNQNSYNSGVWTDYATTTVENQNKFWMPTTPYTQTITYDQRVLINDAGRETPIAWRVSKIEDVQPIGITKLTFTQEVANVPEDCAKYGIANFCPHTEHNGQKSEMCRYCNYAEPIYIDAGLQMPIATFPTGKITYNGTDATIRVGGSAKTFKAEFWDNTQLIYVSEMSDWKIAVYDADVILCSIELRPQLISGWSVAMAEDCPDGVGISVEEDDIRCFVDGKDVFSVQISSTDDYSLKLRCLQNYNMVGKKLQISASSESGQETGITNVEVIS